jgi:hypothetical protein
MYRVRKETEADRRRTVLKLFVGMIGATIKRWQVRDLLVTQKKDGMCGVPCVVCHVRPRQRDRAPIAWHAAWCFMSDHTHPRQHVSAAGPRHAAHDPDSGLTRNST